MERTQVVAPKVASPRPGFFTAAGELLPHQELRAAVWGSKYLDRLNYLHVLITNLRKKIEPNPASPPYIVTAPWVGYSFSIPDQPQEGPSHD